MPTRVPDKSSEIYYTQRAGAGLIVTEATTVSLQGNGSIATPGIYNAAQIDGWRRVTDAVHHAWGPDHVPAVAHRTSLPSSMQADQGRRYRPLTCGQVQTFTSKGFERTTAPRALALEEIPAVTAQFVQAARNAIQAGFDGVELHAGSGYLLDQFLRDGTNRRQDRYGGSIANRCRFVLEILDAVTAEIGGGRTAIRISPMLVTWDCRDSDTVALFSHLVEQLSKRDIAFLDMIERNDASIAVGQDDDADSREHGVKPFARPTPAPYVANGAYDRKSAMAALDSGYAEAISFGRDYISTPDLAQRLATGAALNPAASPWRITAMAAMPATSISVPTRQ